jgi:hypothetical protein
MFRSPQNRTRQNRIINGLFFDTLPSSKHKTTYIDFPRDIDDWACAQWREYYERNKAIEGKEYARTVFINDANRISSIYSKAHSCNYDCDFTKFLENEIGLNFWIGSDIFCATEETAEQLSKTITQTATITKYIFPIVLIGAGYWTYKNYLK